MSLLVAEYLCTEHGRFDMMLERTANGYAPDHAHCKTCGLLSEWTISAPLGRVRLAETTRGKVEAAPTPYHLDTRELGEGMPLKEWKAKRRKVWRDHRIAQNRKALR